MQSLFMFHVLVVVLSFCVGQASANDDVDQGFSFYYPSVRATWATAQVEPWLFYQLTCVSSACIKCGKPVRSQLSVLVADVDQAFECCNSVNVSRALEAVAGEYRRQHGSSSIQVRKGKRYGSKIGDDSWTRGWWSLSLEQLGVALSSAASGTYAALEVGA